MRIKRIYILSLLAALLVSCEDMFVKKVDFQGETDPEMLVLSGTQQVGQKPRVEISHSFFFNNENKNQYDWITDAEVSARINGKSYGLTYYSNGIYLNASAPELQALDTVEFIATHPNYAPVSVKEVMPAQIRCELLSYELQPNNWLTFDLDFLPYQGNADDMIGIRASGKLKGTDSHGREYTFEMNMLYSNDLVFAQAANPETEGYYAAHKDYYLYFPASNIATGKKVSLFIDNHDVGNYYWKTQNLKLEIAALTIQVTACTNSAYQFDLSTRSKYYSKYIYPPSGLPEQQENFMEEIMDAIQETLGDQEPTHVFTNVSGGLGHISGSSSQLLISFGE